MTTSEKKGIQIPTLPSKSPSTSNLNLPVPSSQNTSQFNCSHVHLFPDSKHPNSTAVVDIQIV
jgi:hypothetical protein